MHPEDIEKLRLEFQSIQESIDMWSSELKKSKKYEEMLEKHQGPDSDLDEVEEFLNNRKVIQKQFYKLIEVQQESKAERSGSFIRKVKALRENLDTMDAKIVYAFQGGQRDDHEEEQHLFIQNLRNLTQ